MIFEAEHEHMSQETPHLQGYIQLHRPHSMTWMKTNVHRTAHWEDAKGTPEENITYCSKEKRHHKCLLYQGEPSLDIKKQGQRTDIEEAVRQSKGSISKFIDIAPQLFCQYRNAMKELVRREALRVITDWTKRVIWIKGPTGCGKTRMAVEIGGNDYWMNNATAKWFDNYEGQEVAIIDDFRKEQLPSEAGFGFFLRMLDRYRFMV